LSDQLTTTVEDQAVAQVTLVVPCLAEFVGVVRLAILGVANRISFTYDEVEDVRLAVGEACTHAIERCSEYRAYLTDRGQEQVEVSALKIVCTIDGSTLTVQVTDTIPVAEYVDVNSNSSLDGIDYQKLGTVLMEILVDHVGFEANSSGTTVTLVKTAGQAS